jgi:uncharacterized ion transporter superfamily protein YfcC
MTVNDESEEIRKALAMVSFQELSQRVCVCVCVCIYIYIYIYMARLRKQWKVSTLVQDSYMTNADYESDVSTVLLCSVNSLGLWQLKASSRL